MRFPVIYPYLYKTMSPNDFFISGDSGSGYNDFDIISDRLSCISWPHAHPSNAVWCDLGSTWCSFPSHADGCLQWCLQ